ncbi:MAG: glucose-6-phosphate isomerase [Bacteroidota bacterium]|nr:glucose-6-phosphate isomerase [Bacteroidota bacterium]
MEMPLNLDDTWVWESIGESTRRRAETSCAEARRRLIDRSGPGRGFLGWLDLPETIESHVSDIVETAGRLREETDVLVVIGIGGSYLGARAVIEACGGGTRGFPRIRYAGHHLSGKYLASLLDELEGRRVTVNVISKSGTTTEPAIAFRVLKQWMENRYGRREAAKRIIVTTDPSKGPLRELASKEGYKTFPIPEDVGGRFSVLSAVGLFPIASAGHDVRALLEGARWMRSCFLRDEGGEAPSFRYAAARTALAAVGKRVEVLAVFEPELGMVAEWWKQLFGESEGKQRKGLFPSSVVYTTDLHSLGQYIQEGTPILFETFLRAESAGGDLVVPPLDGDSDGLQYLAGRGLSWINRKAWEGTALAHRAGGVPVMTISVAGLSCFEVGALLYMFQAAVAISGYAIGVNPFDQPGVEAYKRNMFALLGKPGFEREAEALRRMQGAG